MHQQRFDEIVTVLGRDAGLPRRVLLRRVVAGLLGGGLVGRAGGAAAQPGCRGEGHPCEGNQEETVLLAAGVRGKGGGQSGERPAVRGGPGGTRRRRAAWV